MQLTANEETILLVLLDPPDIIFPEGLPYYDIPPRRLTEFVRLTGLAVDAVSDALDSLVAKSVLDSRHGPGDFIKIGVAPPENKIGGVWYGISYTREAKAAYDRVRGRNLRKTMEDEA